jgi:peptidoglycan/LPS O-acetylase OafA/YrhL
LWFWSLVEVALHDATTIFVLISGILFMRVYADRPPTEYWRRRLATLALPYACMTLLFTPWKIGVITPDHATPHGLADLPRAFAANFVYGTGQFTYWFVPVALTTMAIGPVLARMLDSRLRWPLVAVAVVTPLVVWREATSLSPATFTYFVCVYIVGCAWGEHYEWVSQWTSRNRTLLWAVAASASVVLMGIYLRLPKYPDGGAGVAEGLFWIQKLTLSLALVPLLARVRRGTIETILSRCGQYSFPLYFLHFAVAHLTSVLLTRASGGPQGLTGTVGIALVTTVVAIVTPLFTVSVFCRIAPGPTEILLGARASTRASWAPGAMSRSPGMVTAPSKLAQESPDE